MPGGFVDSLAAGGMPAGSCWGGGFGASCPSYGSAGGVSFGPPYPGGGPSSGPPYPGGGPRGGSAGGIASGPPYPGGGTRGAAGTAGLSTLAGRAGFGRSEGLSAAGFSLGDLRERGTCQ